MEREITYAVSYPFVDYGLDLSAMAYFEKGIGSITFKDTPTDINPPPEIVKVIEEKAAKIKPQKLYTLLVDKVGVGPKAYAVKNLVIRGGNGKLDVSPMFKKICYRGEEYPHSFPKKVRKNLHKGPRIASLGHRVSPRQRNVIRFYNKAFHSL